MDTRTLIAQLSDGRFRSGEALATELGVSRSAVWKRLRNLSEMGLGVDAVRGRGYRLRHPFEPLERAAIQAQGAPDAELTLLDSVASTNAGLLARSDAADGAAVVAEHQSAGRGRRGRGWSSPYGAGLWFSVLWRIRDLGREAAALSLLAGVAMMRTLSDLELPGLGLKWPNDIQVQDRKLGGILVELVGEAGGSARAVIGIGLDVDLPRGAGPGDRAWTDMRRELGWMPSRNRLLAGALSALAAVRADLESHGLPTLLEEWERHDLLRDAPVRVERAGGELQGTARGLDETGALLVEGPDGLVTVHAGDVSLRART